ncbi:MULTISPECIES: rod-binding protein [Pseudoalteromonas]|jgi:flagellar protein FlgJ|uniref:Flagellar protein n=2 Tax=Pseudoalteromonas aliena TaxID=247523 RepID=A0A1Q2GV21_9GAMM|nr:MULTISPECIES: rod-binding protein [Pseudoalteromonas]AQP98978.1 flagellar protein [Pseudoalteromonas aliena]AQQ01925.1 flagellar protein [Pseudoalteromonas aliena]MBB1385726.1 rod-binding protein [Pseudoalteromonas sp. SG45-5]MBB1393643.1 rod-binding protein [Pseudoalteromonas sp. SG44-4]MBB1446236.1 rod-binding protein [Pseudoalteromonas sp. SG41-6]
MKIETPHTLSQSLAIDPTNVVNIAKNSTESEGIKQAAEQFEAIFLQLVLKSMNSATETMSGENGFFNSKEQAQFRDMYDAQTAQHLASKHELGLAEAIIRQFNEKIEPIENTFKKDLIAVADPLYKNNEKVEPTQSHDIYSGASFTQSLNIIPIR